MFMPGTLRMAFSYVFGHPIGPVEICHMPSREWQFSDALGRLRICVEGEDDWVFHYPEAVRGLGYLPKAMPMNLKVAKNQVVTITINPDGSIFPDPNLSGYRENLHGAKAL